MADFLSRLAGFKVSSRTTQDDYPVVSSGWVEDYISKHNLSPTYLKPILDATGNLLVASCAGSGKTTALSLKILYDLSFDTIDSHERVWVGTFLRSGAADLKSRLLSTMYDKDIPVHSISSVKISTLHSEFYNAASTLLGFSPEILDDWEDSKLLRRVLHNFGIHENRDGEIFNALNRYSNSLGTKSTLTFVDPEELLEDWRDLRVSSGKWNHSDVQDYLIEQIRTDPDAVDYLASRFNRIYLDEFQDTSLAQYEILKAYLSKGAKCVVVGDDDQTIYSWRGSDVSIITEQFRQDYDPVIRTLPINYRTPSNILDSVVPSIKLNLGRLDKNISAHHEGGELTWVQGALPDLSLAMYDAIQADLNNNLNVAVLCRTNSDGTLPAFQIASNPFITFKTSTGITTEVPLVRASLGVFDFLLTDPLPHRVNSLFETLYKIPRVETARLIELASRNLQTPLEALMSAESADLEHSVPSYQSLVAVFRSLGGKDITVSDYLGAIIDYAYDNTPRRQQLLSVLGSIKNRVLSSGMNSPSANRDFFSTLWAKVTSSSDVSNPDVVISTVHDFKGKEAESVYIWNDTEDVFPHYGSSASEIDEERRIHYIAWTRARKKLTVLSWESNPSRFLFETTANPTSLADFRAAIPEETPLVFGNI